VTEPARWLVSLGRVVLSNAGKGEKTGRSECERGKGIDRRTQGRDKGVKTKKKTHVGVKMKGECRWNRRVGKGWVATRKGQGIIPHRFCLRDSTRASDFPIRRGGNCPLE